MLTLIIGRAGCGKTECLIRRLTENSAKRKQLLIVPEQYSHEAERMLCEAGGNRISLRAEVLSFSRMASRVFSELGGSNVPVLDAGGQLLLMYRAVRQAEERLTVYQHHSRKPAFLSRLLQTSSELKSCCIEPSALTEAGLSVQGSDGGKLRDIGTIMTAYDSLVRARAADPRDTLTRLADKLKDSRCYADYDISVDCFSDFTAQEQRILQLLMRQAYSVTVALTAGEPADRGLPEFETAGKTLLSLSRIAAENGAQTEIIRPDGGKSRTPALSFTEENFCIPGARSDDAAEEIELFTGGTPYDEAEYAAARVRELVRKNGWRWREIGIAARSISGREDELERVFRRYDIPVFLNRMTDITQKPVLLLVTSALETVAGGWAYEDIFRYLKTGLAGLTPEETDLLENYVLEWDIRERDWNQESDWNRPIDNTSAEMSDADKAAVRRLDALRRKAAQPLQRFAGSGAETGAAFAAALYRLLEDIGLRESLQRRAAQFTENGDMNSAGEYLQLWDILISALEQFAQLLPEDRMDLAEFSNLFRLMLEGYDVGSIPVSLDRVYVGDAERMLHKHLKCLIVIGAEDGEFPQVSSPEGLLSDADRNILAGYGIAVGESPEDRIAREFALMYELTALPTERLILCRAEAGSDGAELRPSQFWLRLDSMFPSCAKVRGEAVLPAMRLTAPAPAVEAAAALDSVPLIELLRKMPETAAAAERLALSFRNDWGHLSPASVRALYSDSVSMSASRMDTLKKCHFSFFMNYGLHAEKRKSPDLSAADAGTFVHDILEHVLKNIDFKKGFPDSETAEKMTRSAAEEYFSAHYGGLSRLTDEAQYKLDQLTRSAVIIVGNVLDELRAGEFLPGFFELGFGGKGETPLTFSYDGITLSVNGKIDRVDVWEKDGHLYCRVVDYKTGKKKFEYTDIENGLSLQMIIYLFALQAHAEEIFGRADVTPSGMLYLPAREAVVDGDRSMDEEEHRKAVEKALLRSGLLLRDEEVIDAMEHCEDDSYRFLPLKRKKGKLADNCTASAEQLDMLHEHVDRILRDICSELKQGNVSADPYRHGESSACSYCDYHDACHFEDGTPGCTERRRRDVSEKQFWEELNELYGKEAR